MCVPLRHHLRKSKAYISSTLGFSGRVLFPEAGGVIPRKKEAEGGLSRDIDAGAMKGEITNVSLKQHMEIFSVCVCVCV